MDSMTDDMLQKVLQRVDEALAHKEAVASNVLKDIRDTALERIEELRSELNTSLDTMGKSVEATVERATKDIRSDMEKAHLEMRYQYEGHERRLSFAEKMLFGAAGLILLGVIGALLKNVGI